MTCLRPPALLLIVATAAGCSRGEGEAARRQIFTRGDNVPAAPAADPSRPLEALRLPADVAATRAGAFTWEAKVDWSALREGAAPLRTSETHRLVQAASGDFDVELDLDPGGGPGSVTGRRDIFVGGRTFAGGKWAPIRARESDRGGEARRHRDQSFGMAADLLALFQPALRIDDAGPAEALGRPARRYRLGLGAVVPGAAAGGAAPAKPAAGARPPPPDPDTQRRLDFLSGRVPTALEGEVLIDAAGGFPLSVTLRGVLGEKADPQLRVDVELTARVTALGRAVKPVLAPGDALPDERRPRGVARALEAAGLRKLPRPAVEQEEEDPPP